MKNSVAPEIMKAMREGCIPNPAIDVLLARDIPVPERLPTGVPPLDDILGGGFPAGFSEIYGREGVGKTTLALHVAARAQQGGGWVVYLDADHSLNPEYASRLGADPDRLLALLPETAEQGLTAVSYLLGASPVRLVVIDSLPNLAPENERKSVYPRGGDLTAMIGSWMRSTLHQLHRSRACVLLVNQLRCRSEEVFFSDPETTPCGRALRHTAVVRLSMRPVMSLKEGDVVYGRTVAFDTVKHKFHHPVGRVELPLIFGRGFSGDVVERRKDVCKATTRTRTAAAGG